MRKWDEVTSDGLLTIIEYLKHNFDAELSRKVIELFHERMHKTMSTLIWMCCMCS